MTRWPSFSPRRWLDGPKASSSDFSSNRQPERRGRRMFAAAVLVVIAVAAVVVGAYLIWVSGRDNSFATGRSTDDGQLSGDRKEWIEAVCAKGSLSPPASVNFRFPDATSSAYCTATPPTPDAVAVQLAIIDWPEGVDVTGELQRYPSFRCFAAGAHGDGTTVFSPTAGTHRDVLASLSRFGFTVDCFP